MAKLSTTPPMCDTHDTDVAQALCLNHRRLMCFGCALKEATSKECVVKEIHELDEKHSLILRCLLLRQNSSRKEYLIREHEKKTAELKKYLEQKVMEIYGKLNNRLKQLKDDCLKKLDKEAHDIIQLNGDSKQRLLTFQKTYNKTIDKLSEESIDDITYMERQLNEMEIDILYNIEDKQFTVEGIFKENSILVEAIMQSGANLSNVALIEQEHYAIINDSPESNPDTSKKLPKYLYYENLEIRSKAYFDKKDDDIDSQEHKGKGKYRRKKPETKWGEHKREDKALEAEILGKVCADSTYSELFGAEPKHFINKPVRVSELKKDDFSTALKLVKLIHLGDGYIGMMSETHNSIVIVGLDGKVFGMKNFNGGKRSVCYIDKCAIATVKDPSCQIDKFKVSNEGLTISDRVVTSEQLSNITGFDFDVRSSKFAVSTPEKIIFLNKGGKTEKVTPYNTKSNVNPDELVTLFHFEKERLYILNICNKTLKMFSVKKKKVKWKRKIDSITPKCMCLYEDKLCITCGNSIALYSAASGKPLVKHETKDLLDDCLGLCVIDSVIVFSSGSDDFETSTKLAYISV